jgi:predicted nuclease of restriction endonuclease-like (RecB) superfamily
VLEVNAKLKSKFDNYALQLCKVSGFAFYNKRGGWVKTAFGLDIAGYSTGKSEKNAHSMGRQLTAEYGAGFSEKSLWHMIRFAQAYHDEKIVSALRRELSLTHFKDIIYIDDPLKRDFYTERCRIERWSTHTLHTKIQGMLYERTALSKKSEKLIKQELATLRDEDRVIPDLVFRDPYFLDFLGLSDTYSERDLESAILRELERFLLELGTGFTFAARQKRITIDSEDYYLDLLFYHRSMRRLVAIELKLGKFQAKDKGQMELYRRWLDKYEREGEESPLGLILCAEKTALSMLNYYSLRPAGSGLLNTSPNSRRACFLRQNCMKRSVWRGNRLQPARLYNLILN